MKVGHHYALSAAQVEDACRIYARQLEKELGGAINIPANELEYARRSQVHLFGADGSSLVLDHVDVVLA